MGTGLASTDFWESSYLADVELPARPNPAFQFDRVLGVALARHAPIASGSSVLEVGCAPATWLGFYAERFGARVSGIEYTPRGAELSRRNLEALGVDGEIVHDDFFAVAPTPHDLVLSLGFVEHFDDVAATFAHHAAFVRPGGALAIGVPNYRGLMGVLQRLGDRGHLAMHNTAAMEPDRWRGLAAEHDFEVEWLGYLDGPDPAILSVRRSWLMPAVLLLEGLRRAGVGRRLNAPWISAYLLIILRRPR
jgi:SAM-dependent methyltransferase